MTIAAALDRYKEAKNYFAPDYEQENEVLSQFKRLFPTLSTEQVKELKQLLEGSLSWPEKYFVADLLYLYDSFDEALLEPMIRAAISHSDPSFNRIFLRPCISAFGTGQVAGLLFEQFTRGDTQTKEGIARLLYWLHPRENGAADQLLSSIHHWQLGKSAES